MRRLRRDLSAPPLRLRRHVRRKIEPERQPIRIPMDQPLEHLPTSRSDFQNAHSIANPRILQRTLMSFGMKKERAGRIDRRHDVIHAPSPRRDRLRQLLRLREQQRCVRVAQIWLQNQWVNCYPRKIQLQLHYHSSGREVQGTSRSPLPACCRSTSGSCLRTKL